MPELPEVETLRRQLERFLLGKRIERLEVLAEKSWQGQTTGVVGKEITAVQRKGKLLIIHLSSQQCLLIHLKMTGQLIYEPHGTGSASHWHDRVVGGHPTADFVADLPSSHTRIVFYFAPGGVLYFNDQRRFGWIKLWPCQRLKELPFLALLGPEPFEMEEKYWYGVLESSRQAIKLRLMNQHKVAGIGNIYANDALWLAQIKPHRPANSLSQIEARGLLEAVKQVLAEGIKYGGATAADGKYLDLKGLGGRYQDHFKVYQREGLACLRRDGGVIKKDMLGGRGTYWCPVCQK